MRVTVMDATTNLTVSGCIVQRANSIWPTTFRAEVDDTEIWDIPCRVSRGYLLTPSDWHDSSCSWEDDDVALLGLLIVETD